MAECERGGESARGKRERERERERERGDSWFAAPPGMGDVGGRLHFADRAAAAAGMCTIDVPSSF
jgi:hypothetical protein